MKRVYRKLLKFINVDIRKPITFVDYDTTWHKLLKDAAKHEEKTMFHGAFVGYDDSPRRGALKSIIMRGQNPQKFKTYFKRLLDISDIQNKEYIFFTAWNEWGEGAYLEPDSETKMAYLNAVKELVFKR